MDQLQRFSNRVVQFSAWIISFYYRDVTVRRNGFYSRYLAINIRVLGYLNLEFMIGNAVNDIQAGRRALQFDQRDLDQELKEILDEFRQLKDKGGVSESEYKEVVTGFLKEAKQGQVQPKGFDETPVNKRKLRIGISISDPIFKDILKFYGADLYTYIGSQKIEFVLLKESTQGQALDGVLASSPNFVSKDLQEQATATQGKAFFGALGSILSTVISVAPTVISTVGGVISAFTKKSLDASGSQTMVGYFKEDIDLSERARREFLGSEANSHSHNIKTVILSLDALKDPYGLESLEYILLSQNFAINQKFSLPVIRIPTAIDQLFKLVAQINEKAPITSSGNGTDFSEAKKVKVGFSDRGNLLEWIVTRYSKVRNNPNSQNSELYFSAKVGDYEIELLPASSPEQLQGVKTFLVGYGDNTSSNEITVLKVESPKDLERRLGQVVSSGKGLASTTPSILRLALKPRDALWEQVRPLGVVVQTKDNDLEMKYRTRIANQDVEYVYESEPHDYLLSSNTEGKNFFGEKVTKIFNTGLGVLRASLAAVDAFRGTYNNSPNDNGRKDFNYDDPEDRRDINRVRSKQNSEDE